MSTTSTTISLEQRMLGEVEMVGRDRWEEIHRRAGAGASIRATARELDLDRKTVRRCLRQTEWKPYQRGDTVGDAAELARRVPAGRASAVDYSAQVMYHELRQREDRGSYETVKRGTWPYRFTHPGEIGHTPSLRGSRALQALIGAHRQPLPTGPTATHSPTKSPASANRRGGKRDWKDYTPYVCWHPGFEHSTLSNERSPDESSPRTTKSTISPYNRPCGRRMRFKRRSSSR